MSKAVQAMGKQLLEMEREIEEATELLRDHRPGEEEACIEAKCGCRQATLAELAAVAAMTIQGLRSTNAMQADHVVTR